MGANRTLTVELEKRPRHESPWKSDICLIPPFVCLFISIILSFTVTESFPISLSRGTRHSFVLGNPACTRREGLIVPFIHHLRRMKETKQNNRVSRICVLSSIPSQLIHNGAFTDKVQSR